STDTNGDHAVTIAPNCSDLHCGDPPPDDNSDAANGLTERQLLAVELILAGKSDPQVAEATGACRRTIWTWRNQNAEFQAELHRRRRDRWDGTVDKLRALLDPAVDVLAQYLTENGD